MARERYRGHIATYKRERGFGFLQSVSFSEPLWFHYTYIDGEKNSALYAELYERNDLHHIEISFEVQKTERGLRARHICLVSDYADLEHFLKTESAEKGARGKFLDLISMKALTHIDKDASLTQFAVSRIVRSAKVWEDLTSLAKQWEQAIVLFNKAPNWSSEDKGYLTTFSAYVAHSLRFQPQRTLEFKPTVPAIVQPLLRPDSPLKCFREVQEVMLIILPNEAIWSQIIEENHTFITSDRTRTRIVIQLEEASSLVTQLQNISSLEIALIRQRALIETIMSSETDHPIVVGRNLRTVLPDHKLQPYEVGSAYSDSVFAGRAQERKRILESLESNYAVYGGRKIGKTWFLKDICYRCEKEPNASIYVPFYVSLQAAENAKDAAHLIQEAVSYYLGISLPEDTSAFSGLGNILLEAHKVTGKTVMLALDEVDDVLKTDNYYALFARLRRLQQTYPQAFKFIFAGFKELIHAFYDEASNNPFANWIGKNHFPLGCLHEDDLQSLIVTPLRWVGLEFQPNKILEKVFELTSGHPYYTQSLCHSVVSSRLKQNARTLSPQVIDKLASEEFFYEIFDIFTANLAPLQLLIGKVFADYEKAFTENEIIEALQNRFGLEVTSKRLREEMRILQACSVFIRSADGYKPVMQRINQEFFQHQDDEELAVMYLEESDGV